MIEVEGWATKPADSTKMLNADLSLFNKTKRSGSIGSSNSFAAHVIHM